MTIIINNPFKGIKHKWKEHKERNRNKIHKRPDKIDVIFTIVSIGFLGWAFGYKANTTNLNEMIQLNVARSLDEQAVYYNEVIETKDQEIEDLYNSVIGNVEADLSNMTKSEILEREEELSIFIQGFEAFDLTDNPLYDELKKSLDECYTVIAEGTYLYPYTYTDRDLLAYIIYREAGSSWITDEHRDGVGIVVLNRRNQGGINKDLDNPTIADILNEPGQYPYKSWNFDASVIPSYCYESAERVLEHVTEWPENVIWQATFKQGDGVYKSFYVPKSGTTTYFCYSN